MNAPLVKSSNTGASLVKASGSGSSMTKLPPPKSN